MFKQLQHLLNQYNRTNTLNDYIVGVRSVLDSTSALMTSIQILKKELETYQAEPTHELLDSILLRVSMLELGMSSTNDSLSDILNYNPLSIKDAETGENKLCHH